MYSTPESSEKDENPRQRTIFFIHKEILLNMIIIHAILALLNIRLDDIVQYRISISAAWSPCVTSLPIFNLIT